MPAIRQTIHRSITNGIMTESTLWRAAAAMWPCKKYMQLLDRYLTVCDEVSLDAWEYPTLAQIVKRKSTLQYIRKNAWNAVNSGSGMKEQNVLMVMRANMMLNYDQVNIDYWNSTASALPKGVWRDAARNIYARALYKTGKRLEACNIYAEQGDMQSIKWMNAQIQKSRRHKERVCL